MLLEIYWRAPLIKIEQEDRWILILISTSSIDSVIFDQRKRFRAYTNSLFPRRWFRSTAQQCVLYYMRNYHNGFTLLQYYVVPLDPPMFSIYFPLFFFFRYPTNWFECVLLTVQEISLSKISNYVIFFWGRFSDLQY